jgi:predicted enzyme involved in methoxymalonyl-ACP biosynthesis
MDLESKATELTGIVTEKAIDVVDDVKEMVAEESEKVTKLLEDTAEKAKDTIKEIETRLVEEVKASHCCVPIAFLFRKYSQTPKPILSTREVSESTVSK